MRKLLFIAFLCALFSARAEAQAPTLSSWRDTISNSIGQVLPNATVIICAGTLGGGQAVNTSTQPCSPLATIYSDPYGASPINQTTNPLNTSQGNGTFQFWAASGYYVIQAYGPGISGQLVYGVALGGSGGGGGSVLSVFARTGNVVAQSGDYNFTQLSGSVACSQTPAYTGSATKAAGSCVTVVPVVTTSAPGLMPTLPNNPNEYANGVGGYTIPTSSVPNCTATTAGQVPAPPNDATQFLNGTCNFSVPPGFGALALTDYATGSAFATTNTGTINSGSTSGAIGSCGDFAFGNGLFIGAAGTAGADFIDTVVSCIGTTLTWTDPTATTITSGKTVQHDDTVGVQNAVNACYAVPVTLSCVIFASDGLYRINGPLQTPSGSLGYRVLLPTVTQNSSFEATQAVPTIEFHGQTTPNPAGSTVWFYTGASFITQESGGCTIGGFAPSSPEGNFTAVQLKIEQMSFYAPDNPNTNQICAGTVWQADIDHTMVGTVSPYYNPSQPTHTGSTGVILPLINNGVVARFTNGWVRGYYKGIEFSEDADISGSDMEENYECYVAEPGFHSTTIVDSTIDHCPYGLYAGDLAYSPPGQATTTVLPIAWVDMRIENNAPGGIPPAWTYTLSNVYDPFNGLNGYATWHAVTAGIGTASSIITNGAKNFQLVNMLTQAGGTVPLLQSKESALSGSTTSTITFSSALTNPSEILVSELWVNATTITGCTDTAGNTYAAASTKVDFHSSGYHIHTWKAANASTTASNVITCTSSGNSSGAIMAGEFSGFTNTVDGTPGSSANQTISSAGPNVVTSTSTTTTINGDLDVGIVGCYANSPTPGNIPVNFSAMYPATSGLLMSYSVQPVAGAISPTAGVASADFCATSNFALEPVTALPEGPTITIANGTAALGTGSISSGTCASAVTVAAPGVLATDNVEGDFDADPTSTTGYAPSTSGTLSIFKYPTSGNVNFKVCNNTASSVTPGAVTLNWRVVR